jgi:7-carboxy-7-deazaguanine synthase
MDTRGESLALCELFESIAGESSLAGLPAVFIRLAGCNLRCAWCDTRRSWEPGWPLDLTELVARVVGRRPRLVVITGGEPLLQPQTPALCRRLLQAGKRVQVETNGSLSIAGLPAPVHRVLDIKTPSSGESRRMDWDNLERLRPGDDLKLVLADRPDFDWARDRLRRRPPPPGVQVLLSPAAGRLAPQRLADWLLASGWQVRLQLQLHRQLWPDGRDGCAIPLADP